MEKPQCLMESPEITLLCLTQHERMMLKNYGKIVLWNLDSVDRQWIKYGARHT